MLHCINYYPRAVCTMKFIRFFTFSLICSICKSLTFSKEDCSDLSIGSPEIIIESSSSSFNARVPTSVVEEVTDSEVSRTYFDCRHSTPVQWITDIHPIRDVFRFTRSFYQELGNGTQFSAYAVFLYKPSELNHPTLFICQSVCRKGHNSGQSFLEISPGTHTAMIQTTVTPSTKIFANLWQKLKIGNFTNESNKIKGMTCEMTLNIKVRYDLEEGQHQHHLYYAWKTNWTEGITLRKKIFVSSQTTTDQGIYFRNVFRSIPQERHCVKLLQPEDACSGCIEVVPTSTYGDEKTFLNSVAFFARSNIETKVAFKGVFSVTNPRRFYFDWELPLEEMVDFQPPSVVYVGHDVTFTCNVSTIYFAYGSLIYANIDNSTIINVKASPINETWMPDGRRLVKKTMRFPSGNETISLTCSAPLWDWSMRVDKTANIFVDYSASPEIEGGSRPEQRIVEDGQENVTLICSAKGKPRPRLEWVFPNQNISKWVEVLHEFPEDNLNQITSTITISKITRKLLGTYRCFVQNTFGNSSKAIHLQIPLEGLSASTKAGLSSGLGAVGLIGIVTLALIYRKILVQRREYKTKTDEAIREFKEGIKQAQLEKEKQTTFFWRGSTKKDKLGEDIDGGILQSPHQSILELPYDDRFEVDSTKWEIEETLLGQGAFGYVRKGAVEVENKKNVVAVKMLKSAVDIDDFKGFLTELKIMAYIGRHSNVVSLLAACTQHIEQRDVMIGVEFCAHGSLQDYLKEKRSMFKPMDGSRNIDSCRKTYTNLANSVALTELDLFTWSYQIANGMEFLASKQVLHGDLATRNVLLTSDKTAKISDFGLSRLLLENKNYTKKSRVPLPWKWMALESLKALHFSSASDVWAFGVTIFEIFTLGEVPYAGLSFGPEFIIQIENGFRLAKPPLATEYVYNIMKHCWNPEVDSRVKFPQLKTAFSELLDVFTNPGGAPVPLSRNRINTPTSAFQNSPVAQPRRARGLQNRQQENWYSNRPIQIPNLYLNV